MSWSQQLQTAADATPAVCSGEAGQSTPPWLGVAPGEESNRCCAGSERGEGRLGLAPALLVIIVIVFGSAS